LQNEVYDKGHVSEKIQRYLKEKEPNIISKNVLQMSTIKLDELSKKQPKRLLAKIFTKTKNS